MNLKFENKTTLLFDLDGTLVDSVPDLANAVNATLETLDRPPFSHDVIRGWVGNGASMLIQRALSGSVTINDTLDEAFVSRALTLFLTHYKNTACQATKAYPQVRSTLNILKQRGYRLAIITNKPKQFVPDILTKLEMDGLFELVLGGDCLPTKKPDPQPLLFACEQLAASPLECVMIGDSKNDILAAKAADMHSVGLTYGYNYDEAIDVYQPEYVLSQFEQLLDLLP